MRTPSSTRPSTKRSGAPDGLALVEVGHGGQRLVSVLEPGQQVAGVGAPDVSAVEHTGMVARVKEILDGLCHFSARHERIDTDVSSYWYASGRVLIDPMRPSGGIDALPGEDGPTDVLLTNRHHWRHSGEYAQAYGVTVHASRPGMHEFGEDQPVTPFDFGDELPGGAVAHEVGTILPDETALHLPGLAAVAFADGLVRIPPDEALERFVDGG